MTFRINHIHIKALHPRETAEWWAKAFNFRIVSDDLRFFGDRFVRCRTDGGDMIIAISNSRTGETLAPSDPSPRYGLEHFGVVTQCIESDIARLESLGARLAEGPPQVPDGPRFAFLCVPGEVRVELVELPLPRTTQGLSSRMNSNRYQIRNRQIMPIAEARAATTGDHTSRMSYQGMTHTHGKPQPPLAQGKNE